MGPARHRPWTRRLGPFSRHAAPAIISDDYFDLRLIEGAELAAPEDTTREDILKEAGYEQTYDVDEIIVRIQTPDETARLASKPEHPSPSTDALGSPPRTSPSA